VLPDLLRRFEQAGLRAVTLVDAEQPGPPQLPPGTPA
jgi:hypothetical protein